MAYWVVRVESAASVGYLFRGRVVRRENATIYSSSGAASRAAENFLLRINYGAGVSIEPLNVKSTEVA